VIRQLPGGYELDDDPERVDLAAVHRYLTDDSYWAEGRDRATVDLLHERSAQVIGLYDPTGATVGYCRVLSDGFTLAYLADVYVLPAHRGRGLGVELVRQAVDEGPLSHLRWALQTQDAHELYRRFGFGPAPDTYMERPRTLSS
jgi:GNAT superfamily N-acetyltransferase